MNKFSKYISSQFKNPRGIGGVIISIIQNVINKAMYKRAVSLINLQSNENILDIGYGNGHLLEMIYRKNPVNIVRLNRDLSKMRGTLMKERSQRLSTR